MDCEQLRDETVALWTAVFGEPPPVCGDPALTLRVLLESLTPRPYRPAAPDVHAPTKKTPQ